MKKLLLILPALLTVLGLQAQTIRAFRGGEVVYEAADLDSVLFLQTDTTAVGRFWSTRLQDDHGWWARTIPDQTATGALYDIASDTVRLEFFGWSQSDDHRFTMQLPTSTAGVGRVLLRYHMCSKGKGPAEWDMTTQIMVRDKQTDEWYEIARCITPYGSNFRPAWHKIYYLDVTPLLPLLQGETEFKVFYCGWDATATRAHAMKIDLVYLPDASPYGTPLWHQKVYDSTLSGNSGYRSWAYGVQPADSFSIEAPERLGLRTLSFPAGTKRVVLRSCLTGHGQDALTVGNGSFPTRPGYTPENVAEFDENRYTFTLNGQLLEQEGSLWELNGNNYSQAGTYQYDRCGWGPGKPCNVHYWVIDNIPAGTTSLTLDFDLYEYISLNTAPNAESVAQFYVEVDAFGYQ